MPDFSEELLEKFTKELDIEKITAKCLINCGLKTIEECKEFLHPSFDSLTKVDLYPGFSEVKERLNRAIENNESIMIYGDYDVDGICSTALMYLFLKSKGVENVNYFIPDRRENGYGMNSESLEELQEEFNPDLYITVDCGIGSVEEIDYIIEGFGSDVIVTDHHQIPAIAPNCPIFNPHLCKDETFADLCGAGVVLRLIEGMTSFEESKQYYDIAALATIADMMPLVKDNRIIVKYGIELLNKHKRKGLYKLISTFTKEEINSTDIGFKLAPKLNAVGRLKNTNQLIDLFTEDDDFLLDTLVEDINETNQKRQVMSKKLLEEVEEAISGYDFEKYPIIVLKGAKWDEGILGICASSIQNEFNHPVLLFTKTSEGLKGSGRSIPNINIYECVSSQSELLSRFGGHPQACGLSLDESNFEAFKEGINAYCKSHFDDSIYLENHNDYFDFHEIKDLKKVAKELMMLEPYGEKNKKPLFGCEIQNLKFKRIKIGSNHIVYKNRGFQMVGFNMADKLPVLNNQLRKIITFNIQLNIYNNVESVQAILKSTHCIEFEDGFIDNYIKTALYEDKSIFHPKAIEPQEAIKLIEGNKYSTAFICYSKSTFNAFKEKCKEKLLVNAFYMDFAAPNNALFFNLDKSESLDKYKNVVFLDRPISLGYIDELKLNKDCVVYYVENNEPMKNLKNYLSSYEELGLMFKEIDKLTKFNSYMDIWSLYMDIEKSLNVNYNNLVVAMHIFADLGILIQDAGVYKIDKKVKNPISNSKLYKKIIGA
jgi:single-stranded-DNA-specific exonuclease